MAKPLILQLKEDNVTNRTEIEQIKAEQTTQNTRISTNETNITELQGDNESNKENIAEQEEEIEELREDLNNSMLSGEAEGETITLEDSANQRIKSLKVSGNSKQETGDVLDNEGTIIGSMPSPDCPSEIKTVGSAEIKVCNKNIVDQSELLKAGVILNENGYCEGKGSVVSSVLFYPPIKNQQIIVSANCYSTDGIIYLRIYYTDGTNTNASNSSGEDELLTVKSNVNKTVDYIKFGYSNKDQTSYVKNLQCEIGETATDYVEHKEQSFIMPTQKEMLEDDYFDLETNEEVHKLKKLELTGQENFVYYSTSDFSVFYSDILAGLVNNSKYICTHFKRGMYTTTNNVIQINGAGRLHLRNDNYNSASDFKSWLAEQYEAGTPVTIYYQLAEEERLPFTSEQLAVAKEIKKAKTYKNITHIFSDDDISPQFKVEYYKDLETVINNMQAQILAGEE